MKKTYLKPRMECVILFTIDVLFTMDVIWWGWEKNPEIYKKKNEYEKARKKFPVYELEADCFPVSGNTENNLDLP